MSLKRKFSPKTASLSSSPAPSPTASSPKNSKLVFTFGRFQPPHVGHALLIKQVLAEAKRTKSDHYIVVSSSCNKAWLGSKGHKRQRTESTFESCKANENPLKIDRRVFYLQKMFPSVRFLRADHVGKSIFSAIKSFKEDSGYTDITAMFGGDRVNEMNDMFNKYEMNIKVKSVGQRDDNADDITGASATKMREAAVRGGLDNIKYFVDHAQIGDMSLSDTLAMMQEVRDSLWSNESKGGAKRASAVGIVHKPRPLKYKLKPDEKPPRAGQPKIHTDIKK